MKAFSLILLLVLAWVVVSFCILGFSMLWVRYSSFRFAVLLVGILTVLWLSGCSSAEAY